MEETRQVYSGKIAARIKEKGENHHGQGKQN